MIFQVALLLDTMPEGRVFGLDQQMFISVAIMLFNALFLAVVLTLVLYKPVQKFMRDRADKISTLLREGQDKAAKADRLKAEYEKKLREIDAERLHILEAARRDAFDRSRRLLDDAKSEADDIRRRAHESAAAEKERLKEEARLHIIEVSSLMAEKVIAHSIDKAAHDRLFDETMAELEETTWPT